MEGDFTTAVAAYLAQLTADPDDRPAWVGLALAQTRIGGGAVWRTAPELPYAVHRTVRATGAKGPDPVRLGEWLDGAGQVGGGSTTQ